jgi:hypothetical protein
MFLQEKVMRDLIRQERHVAPKAVEMQGGLLRALVQFESNAESVG